MHTDINGRYGLNPAHSELVAACQLIAADNILSNKASPLTALDMGCSNGRNALYLSAQGFDVTGVDTNGQALAMVQDIMQQEGITNLTTQRYDINQASLTESYDLIACLVTLMFLEPSRVNAVLADMQAHTVPGGYNLIVCAMDTPDYPCPMNFPFTLQAGELATAYLGWERVKYNENLGTMHNGAQLQFATLLARKPQK